MELFDPNAGFYSRLRDFGFGLLVTSPLVPLLVLVVKGAK